MLFDAALLDALLRHDIACREEHLCDLVVCERVIDATYRRRDTLREQWRCLELGLVPVSH